MVRAALTPSPQIGQGPSPIAAYRARGDRGRSPPSSPPCRSCRRAAGIPTSAISCSSAGGCFGPIRGRPGGRSARFRQRPVHRYPDRLFNSSVERDHAGARSHRPPHHVARLLDRMDFAAVLIAIDEWLQWRIAASLGAAPPFVAMVPALVISICVFPVIAWIVSRIDALEARAMKHMRITTAHQSITFSRRMMLLGGAQAAVGGLLIGRMGWLAIAQNEKYQLLSESNRVQLIPVPPRRGWIIDRERQADRHQQGKLPRRPHPAADRQWSPDRCRASADVEPLARRR